MRARYYSPDLRRFINADIVPGELSNAITLNRYAYANGNPVSNIDPFGLSANNGMSNKQNSSEEDFERLLMDILISNNVSLDSVTSLDTLRIISEFEYESTGDFSNLNDSGFYMT